MKLQCLIAIFLLSLIELFSFFDLFLYDRIYDSDSRQVQDVTRRTFHVFRLRRDRVLFDNKLLYPGGCTKDDCLDPDGFIDYILPRLIIIGAAFLLCGAFTALVVFIPAMDTLVCNILEIVFPIAAIAWYSFVSRHAAREYWGV